MDTVTELLTQAQQHEQAAQDSFDRCDTDGFLSQYASNLNALLCRARADIARRNGFYSFPCLMKGERRVDARLIDGQFGRVWLLSEAEAGVFRRQFIPFAGSGSSRVQKRLGLHEGEEDAPAAARIVGEGAGLSGRAWVEIYRTDGR